MRVVFYWYNEAMKLTREFDDITAKDFFDYVENHLIKEIEETTGKVIKKKDIVKGLRYVKPIEGQQPVIITLKDYKKGKVYASKVESGNETAVTSYRVNPTEKGVEVEMEMEVSEYEKIKDSLSRFKRNYYETVYLGRMQKQLGQMMIDISREKQGLNDPKDFLGKKAMEHISEKVNEKLFKRNDKKEKE